MSKLTFVSLILSLAFIVGCQAAQPTTTPAMPTATVAAANTALAAATEEPMPDRVETATATSTTIPLPTETAMPTPLPTFTPTPDPVWSILFTGNACSKTATNCTAGPDTPPPDNYFIYSDGTGMLPLSEIEGIPHNIKTVNSLVLSPDQSRVAFYSSGKLLLGDVGGDTYSEVATGEFSFSPHSFYGEDPNCLAGFDDKLENGEVVVSLYKSCIGDAAPTLVETAVLPLSRTGSQYLLSPEGDKWAAYTIGNSTLDEQAVLHVHKIGDPNPPQPIFQQQVPTCTSSMHWQDTETLEFLYAECDNTHDRLTYFYVTDWEGKVLTTRYELPALEVSHPVRASFYAVATGDWFSENNLFVYSISINGSPPPEFNGLYVLNFTTGEVQQILSYTSVFAVKTWLPVTTTIEE
ncbi:MAG: hypothetical protein R6X34_29470 [Chloroflexota bacterium]